MLVFSSVQAAVREGFRPWDKVFDSRDQEEMLLVYKDVLRDRRQRRALALARLDPNPKDGD
ncbi:MAG TPA: hypothetical protein VEI97_15895, partial [bacterium]|nr:hypothetical protein [bacterium]